MGMTDIGLGKAALLLSGGGVTGYTNSSGSVAYTSTTVTPGASPVWTASTGTNYGTANVWTGFICVAGGTTTTSPLMYGVITSNTATALTVDQWYSPASPSGAAIGPPTVNSPFIIIPGNASCWWMGIGTGSTAAADTSLASEQSTNGLVRSPATFAHTFSNSSANTTYTLTNTYTYSGSGAVTLSNIGIFDAKSNGIPLFTTALSPTATVTASGDTVTVTDTVTV